MDSDKIAVLKRLSLYVHAIDGNHGHIKSIDPIPGGSPCMRLLSNVCYLLTNETGTGILGGRLVSIAQRPIVTIPAPKRVMSVMRPGSFSGFSRSMRASMVSG